MSKETGQESFRHSGAVHESELKVCDLCSSLNLECNEECFICGWNGHFERSYDVVHTAVMVAVQRYGQLELENLTDLRNYRRVTPSFGTRLRGWLDHLWKWLSS